MNCFVFCSSHCRVFWLPWQQKQYLYQELGCSWQLGCFRISWSYTVKHAKTIKNMCQTLYVHHVPLWFVMRFMTVFFFSGSFTQKMHIGNMGETALKYTQKRYLMSLPYVTSSQKQVTDKWISTVKNLKLIKLKGLKVGYYL